MHEAPHITLLQFMNGQTKQIILKRLWMILYMYLRVRAHLRSQKLCFHSLLRSVRMVQGVNKLSFRWFHWIIFIYSTNWVIWPERLLCINSNHLYLYPLSTKITLYFLLYFYCRYSTLQLHSLNSLQHDETFVLQLMAKRLDHREYIEQTRHCVFLSTWIGAKKKSTRATR